MAFRSGKRKDVKKQSYYVWFLGAKESKGLRGEEYIRPVLRCLIDKERESEPMKVTLQVSNKGLKIIQNVARKTKGKTEQIKHFIPHHAITCVRQESAPNDDIVCTILLIYNPLTKCPVHVHAYRCDSVETAATLRSQLQILVERPENQKKFREIENRLSAKGLLPSRRLNSDGLSTRTDGSDQTEDSAESERDIPVRKDITSLYDSLAAELRERLKNRDSCPILLPPKDYDTVSRKQGKLNGIELRKSTNIHLVGSNIKKQEVDSSGKSTGKSSGKSSGIGSDEALSSAIQEVTSHAEFEGKELDPDTSSDDEDWPEAETLPEEDEMIHFEWRRVPPAVHIKPKSTSPNPHVHSHPRSSYSSKDRVSRTHYSDHYTRHKDDYHKAPVINRDARSHKYDSEMCRRSASPPRATRPFSYSAERDSQSSRGSILSNAVPYPERDFRQSHRSSSRKSPSPVRRGISPSYSGRYRSQDMDRHPEERRKQSHYQPDNREYRYSYVEPNYRRVPLDSQY